VAAGEADSAVVEVEHRDGRRWTVRCRRESRGSLSESCGKVAVEAFVWVPTVVD
jgi:hypothetical protein